MAAMLLIGGALGVSPSSARAQPLDPLEGMIVRAIRVTGLRHVSADVIDKHMETRAGRPFVRAVLRSDQRRLDELRLFTSVVLEPQLEDAGLAVSVAVAETLRVLPIVVVSVTDENGVSAGPGVRGINLLGHELQSAATVRFGGETAVAASVDATTITPGTWATHAGFSDSRRRNGLYEFEEHATSADVRLGRNWSRGVRTGMTADVLAIRTGDSGVSLSSSGTDVIPRLGAFFTIDTLDSSTNPWSGTWAEVQVERLFGDAESWTVVLDGRRSQRLSERHGLGVYSLATFQTGEVGVDLPEYLQFALGGGNTVRGWSLGSRRGRNQYIGTMEYTFVLHPVDAFSIAGINLYAGLQLVAFGDVGMAWNTRADFSTSQAIDGYGIGLRALVPFVDVLRLDVAFGEPGRGATAYFGVSLKTARQRQRVR
jgi:outer membrane protein assembly factor BamA